VAVGAADTAAYDIPPFGELGCWPLEEAFFGDEPAPVAGRRVAGSEESLACSVDFRFPDDRCRFFIPSTAVNALRNSGDMFPLDILLTMTCCSSCDSDIFQSSPPESNL
jgi:hypothetical protein